MEDFSLIKFLLGSITLTTILYLFMRGNEIWSWWKYGAKSQHNLVRDYFYTYLFVAIPFLLIGLFDNGGSGCVDAGRWGGVNC